ncbi:hypothetical protein [Rhodopirellula europaea]|uniref:Uncharacterized protein n=1 Tax=Rhodopirellula europaea 6C TaxID=1263867 RepID=M2ATM4_9BACT|nr:hypothetical protein [Rhodopirellula europaea]EMB16037.1 hypothetical protein RE6C_03229 [Rhodopirellula europaea 6C]
MDALVCEFRWRSRRDGLFIDQAQRRQPQAVLLKESNDMFDLAPCTDADHLFAFDLRQHDLVEVIHAKDRLSELDDFAP